MAFDRSAYRTEHFLVTKRFGQKVDCPGPHSLDGHMNIAVTGYEDDRCLNARTAKFAMQVETARPLQSDVQYETAREIR